MIVHCNMKFRPDEIQFLRDNEMFTHRRLEIGYCPKCQKKLARLVEKRILDNKIFDTTYKGLLVEKVIKQYFDEILYKSTDQVKQKGLYGYRYGEGREKEDKNGNITITQKACDFYGNKEVVKQETKLNV